MKYVLVLLLVAGSAFGQSKKALKAGAAWCVAHPGVEHGYRFSNGQSVTCEEGVMTSTEPLMPNPSAAANFFHGMGRSMVVYSGLPDPDAQQPKERRGPPQCTSYEIPVGKGQTVTNRVCK